MGIEYVGTSDAELVRRVLGGDTGAYGALVGRYRDRLGRYAVHMLGNREDAEEALQDAFVRGLSLPRAATILSDSARGCTAFWSTGAGRRAPARRDARGCSCGTTPR